MFLQTRKLGSHFFTHVNWKIIIGVVRRHHLFNGAVFVKVIDPQLHRLVSGGNVWNVCSCVCKNEVLITIAVAYILYKSRWGLRVRATVANRTMANATGINTKRTDRLTFAIGCGIAGVAGAAFTTIGSTGPTSGSLYIVDAFLVVTFGGAASLLGTVASAFGIAQTQSISEFFMSGSNAKVLTLSAIVVILMLRPQGLFASKVRR